MADMHDIPACSSSSPPPDDISLFLRQILLRSSSPSSLSPFPDFPPYPPPPPLAAPAAVASSSSVGNTDNDPDEYDCESEEGFEAHPRKAPSRNSSKRSRAAEVHNLSEKRRRSKINEKMKALQKLIPNSNKTDKASMLDEAIEYLKQLQLQVQMLTMRNGSSLYPSELLQNNQLSHIKMTNFCEVNDSLTNIHPSVLHQEQHPINGLLTIPNQQLSLEGNDHNRLGIQNHLVRSEQQQQLNMIPDLQSVFPLNAKGRSNIKDDGLEACIPRRSDGQDDEMPDNSVFLLPHLSGLKRGRRDVPKI